jgi:hypothetical protein
VEQIKNFEEKNHRETLQNIARNIAEYAKKGQRGSPSTHPG